MAALDASDASTSRFRATLDRLLREYAPTDPREVGFRTRMLELGRHPRAAERSHFDPGHFTASAFVLSPDEAAVLLIFHKKLGKWLQPGGHVERNDASPLDTARREVLEEVGLSELLPETAACVFDIDIHDIPARATEPAHEHFDVRFLFRTPTRSFSATAEVADAKWVSVAEASRVTADESVLRALRKIGAR